MKHLWLSIWVQGQGSLVESGVSGSERTGNQHRDPKEVIYRGRRTGDVESSWGPEPETRDIGGRTGS